MDRQRKVSNQNLSPTEKTRNIRNPNNIDAFLLQTEKLIGDIVEDKDGIKNVKIVYFFVRKMF